MTVLSLSPHTDDSELGAGGTLARHVEAGDRVVIVAFSPCRESLPTGLDPDTLIEEAMAAANRLGAEVFILDYPVRRFTEHRQEILDELIAFRDEYRPDLVLCPAADDKHQDHTVVYEEARRAFYCTIHGYLLPWNATDASTRHFVELAERHVEAKLRACAAYDSQQHRQYMNPDRIRARASYHGDQSRYAYAEAFEVVRSVSRVAA